MSLYQTAPPAATMSEDDGVSLSLADALLQAADTVRHAPHARCLAFLRAERNLASDFLGLAEEGQQSTPSPSSKRKKGLKKSSEDPDLAAALLEFAAAAVPRAAIDSGDLRFFLLQKVVPALAKAGAVSAHKDPAVGLLERCLVSPTVFDSAKTTLLVLELFARIREITGRATTTPATTTLLKTLVQNHLLRTSSSVSVDGSVWRRKIQILSERLFADAAWTAANDAILKDLVENSSTMLKAEHGFVANVRILGLLGLLRGDAVFASVFVKVHIEEGGKEGHRTATLPTALASALPAVWRYGSSPASKVEQGGISISGGDLLSRLTRMLKRQPESVLGPVTELIRYGAVFLFNQQKGEPAKEFFAAVLGCLTKNPAAVTALFSAVVAAGVNFSENFFLVQICEFLVVSILGFKAAAPAAEKTLSLTLGLRLLEQLSLHLTAHSPQSLSDILQKLLVSPSPTMKEAGSGNEENKALAVGILAGAVGILAHVRPVADFKEAVDLLTKTALTEKKDPIRAAAIQGLCASTSSTTAHHCAADRTDDTPVKKTVFVSERFRRGGPIVAPSLADFLKAAVLHNSPLFSDALKKPALRLAAARGLALAISAVGLGDGTPPTSGPKKFSPPSRIICSPASVKKEMKKELIATLSEDSSFFLSEENIFHKADTELLEAQFATLEKVWHLAFHEYNSDSSNGVNTGNNNHSSSSSSARVDVLSSASGFPLVLSKKHHDIALFEEAPATSSAEENEDGFVVVENKRRRFVRYSDLMGKKIHSYFRGLIATRVALAGRSSGCCGAFEGMLDLLREGMVNATALGSASADAELSGGIIAKQLVVAAAQMTAQSLERVSENEKLLQIVRHDAVTNRINGRPCENEAYGSDVGRLKSGDFVLLAVGSSSTTTTKGQTGADSSTAEFALNAALPLRETLFCILDRLGGVLAQQHPDVFALALTVLCHPAFRTGGFHKRLQKIVQRAGKFFPYVYVEAIWDTVREEPENPLRLGAVGAVSLGLSSPSEEKERNASAVRMVRQLQNLCASLAERVKKDTEGDNLPIFFLDEKDVFHSVYSAAKDEGLAVSPWFGVLRRETRREAAAPKEDVDPAAPKSRAGAAAAPKKEPKIPFSGVAGKPKAKAKQKVNPLMMSMGLGGGAADDSKNAKKPVGAKVGGKNEPAKPRGALSKEEQLELLNTQQTAKRKTMR